MNRQQIDVIGILWRQPARPDGWTLGEPLPAPEALEGWHVNVTPEVLAERPELEPFIITPARMRRVWAGDDPYAPTRTVALRFEDQAEAESVIGGAE